MDVSAPRPVPHVNDIPPRRFRRPDAVTEGALETTRDTEPGARDPRRWATSSTLKSSLTPADVNARFEVHEPSNRVTVTMYERTTGEVLRDFPSRRVLDTIAAITANGLRVDASG